MEQQPTSVEVPQIDVRGVFAAKNPKLARWLPGFVYNYLRRVVHEREVNEALYRYRDLYGLDFVDAVVCEEFKLQIPTVGLDELPAEGRYIVVANHPLGGLDGLALMHAIGKRRKDLRFPVNDILLNLPNLRELFIPINKHGSNKDNIELLNRAFASDEVLLFFPAGLVSRKQKGGRIEDLEWQKTFLTKAVRYGRSIVPAHIGGRNSNFFYNLANWRKRLGIKGNIEMLYLVDEMFRQKERELPIIFSKPLPPGLFDRSLRPEQWAQLLKRFVYSLPEQPQAEFDTARLLTLNP